MITINKRWPNGKSPARPAPARSGPCGHESAELALDKRCDPSTGLFCHVTGDGLAAGLLLCSARRGRPLCEAASVVRGYVQCQVNVAVASKELTGAVREAVERANAELGREGRVLVRPSGTEPIIRVLVEARDGAVAEEACARIVRLVESELG